MTGCVYVPYKFSTNNYAGRPVPPSRLGQRVMVAAGQASGSGAGALELLDAFRDTRSNIYTANSTFFISGYGAAMPELILNYPEQSRGFVYAQDGSLQTINYGTEASLGSTPAAALPAISSSIYVPPDTQAVYSAEESQGLFIITSPGASSLTAQSQTATYTFPVPGVYRVIVNQAHTVVLLMIRNSNQVYRLLFLSADQVPPAGALTCEPVNKPVYCVIPVGATQPDGSVREPAFHRPVNAYFSPDGTQVLMLDCGIECGGSAATGDDVPNVAFMNTSSLIVNNYPTASTYTSPVTNVVDVPGGVTDAISDGDTLYVAGQSLQPDGLFAGNLSLIPLSTKTVAKTFSISDGNHTKMLFADNNTLWIGAQNCANGEKFAHSQNYNCLTRYDITNASASIVPAVTPGQTTVPYPNQNLDPLYYGSLTGLCWVEGYGKVYTAYGGQVHAFKTSDGSEINNFLITVQGVANDVAYLDATTNETD